MAPGGLRMIGRFNVPPEAIPHPDRPLAKPYWEQVLKPMLNIDTADSVAEVADPAIQ